MPSLASDGLIRGNEIWEPRAGGSTLPLQQDVQEGTLQKKHAPKKRGGVQRARPGWGVGRAGPCAAAGGGGLGSRPILRRSPAPSPKASLTPPFLGRAAPRTGPPIPLPLGQGGSSLLLASVSSLTPPLSKSTWKEPSRTRLAPQCPRDKSPLSRTSIPPGKAGELAGTAGEASDMMGRHSRGLLGSVSGLSGLTLSAPCGIPAPARGSWVDVARGGYCTWSLTADPRLQCWRSELDTSQWANTTRGQGWFLLESREENPCPGFSQLPEPGS